MLQEATATRESAKEATYLCHLPNEVLCQIWQLLPFNQRVRLGRVCKRFRKLSLECISEIKTLDLQEGIFQRLKGASLAALLALCSRKLEEVKLRSSVQLVSTFSEFTCPKLSKLFLKTYGCTRDAEIGNDFFRKVAKRNPNLESVIWRSRFAFTFPTDLVMEKLTALKIDECDFRSLARRCPNLRHFRAVIEAGVSEEAIDEFFAAAPLLETLVFPTIESVNVRFDRLEHFWGLRHLRVLAVDHSASGVKMNERALTKIAQRFPLLETLDLRFLDVRSDAVAKLAFLGNLRVLTLHSNGYNEIDEGIQRIAKCGRLRKAQFDGEMSPATLTQLVWECPELQYLWLYRVKGITKTGETVGEALRSLKEVGRNVTIRICQQDGLIKSDTAARRQSGRVEGIRFEGGEARSFIDAADHVMALFE